MKEVILLFLFLYTTLFLGFLAMKGIYKLFGKEYGHSELWKEGIIALIASLINTIYYIIVIRYPLFKEFGHQFIFIGFAWTVIIVYWISHRKIDFDSWDIVMLMVSQILIAPFAVLVFLSMIG